MQTAAEQHLASQQELQTEALLLLDKALQNWSGKPEDWAGQVLEIGDDLLEIQVSAAAGADAYLAAVLAAQGATPAPEGAVSAAAFADLTDGGGSWLRKLVFAVAAVAEVEAPELERALWVARSIVLTGMQDVGRSAVQTAMQAEPSVSGYVRMLNAPSCSRCVILAGRVYRSATPFRRHPRCDCRHIPQAEDGDDWTTSPRGYFNSLTAEEQDETFGPENAEAIRLGANISQVVNAEQGVTTVSAYGRELTVTTTGTTVRALFGGYEVLADGTVRRRPDSELRRLPGERYRRTTELRLMPDQIFQLAEEFSWDRAETLRQLRRFGYII
ncbi:hypothetical protein [Saccharopolyspora taberi]|uniref:VG15 protein n=1 Tax=Saccharopolyspora taberi TaxID=60895 RepID=UPI0031D6D91B